MTPTPITSADLDETLALYAEYRVPSTPRHRIAQVLDTFPSIGLRDDRGRLLGFCYTCELAPEILEIHNIYVARSHRGHGLGARLFAEIEALSVAAGYQSLVATNALSHAAREDRRSPETAYLRAGFRVALACETTTLFVKEISARGPSA